MHVLPLPHTHVYQGGAESTAEPKRVAERASLCVYDGSIELVFATEVGRGRSVFQVVVNPADFPALLTAIAQQARHGSAAMLADASVQATRRLADLVREGAAQVREIAESDPNRELVMIGGRVCVKTTPRDVALRELAGELTAAAGQEQLPELRGL